MVTTCFLSHRGNVISKTLQMYIKKHKRNKNNESDVIKGPFPQSKEDLMKFLSHSLFKKN